MAQCGGKGRIQVEGDDAGRCWGLELEAETRAFAFAFTFGLAFSFGFPLELGGFVCLPRFRGHFNVLDNIYHVKVFHTS